MFCLEKYYLLEKDAGILERTIEYLFEIECVYTLRQPFAMWICAPSLRSTTSESTLSASGHGSDVLLNAVSKRSAPPRHPQHWSGNRGEWTQVSFSLPNLVHLC